MIVDKEQEVSDLPLTYLLCYTLLYIFFVLFILLKMSEDMDHLTRLKTSEKIYSGIQLVVSAAMIAVSLT